MAITCAEVRQELPAYAGDREASLEVRRHLVQCAGCRAELERYEALAGELARLRSAVFQPPPGLAASLAAIPSNETRVAALKAHVSVHRKAYAGGLALACAGALGAALWRAKRGGVAFA